MFEPTVNTPEVFLNEDFIGVWDNVTLDDFNNSRIGLFNAGIKFTPFKNNIISFHF